MDKREVQEMQLEGGMQQIVRMTRAEVRINLTLGK